MKKQKKVEQKSVFTYLQDGLEVSLAYKKLLLIAILLNCIPPLLFKINNLFINFIGIALTLFALTLYLYYPYFLMKYKPGNVHIPTLLTEIIKNSIKLILPTIAFIIIYLLLMVIFMFVFLVLQGGQLDENTLMNIQGNSIHNVITYLIIVPGLLFLSVFYSIKKESIVSSFFKSYKYSFKYIPFLLVDIILTGLVYFISQEVFNSTIHWHLILTGIISTIVAVWITATVYLLFKDKELT